MGAYSKRESFVIERQVREHELLEPLEGMKALDRLGGITNAVRHGLVGYTRWAHSMHAKLVRKFRFDPTLRQRTIKANRHPRTS